MSFPGMQTLTATPKATPLDAYSIQYVSGKTDIVRAHEVQWGSGFTRWYAHPNQNTRILELAVNNDLIDYVTELTPEEIEPKLVS